MMFSYLQELKEHAGDPTNAEIASRSGVPESTIAKMMSGNVDNPRFQNVVDVVMALDGSLDELVGIVKAQPESVKIDDPIGAVEKVLEVEETVARPLEDSERQRYRDRIQRVTEEALRREERIREEARKDQIELRREYDERERVLRADFAECMDSEHRRETVLFVLVFLQTAFIMTVLLIDLLNPNIGYFRYLATTMPEAKGIIDTIGRFL